MPNFDESFERVLELEKCIQDVIDLLRTGLVPDVLNMTKEEWNIHKINKAVWELSFILDDK